MSWERQDRSVLTRHESTVISVVRAELEEGGQAGWCSVGGRQPLPRDVWALLQPQDLVEDEALFIIQPTFIEYLPHGREISRNCGGDTEQVRQGSCPPGDDILVDEASGDQVTEPRTR